MRGNCSPPSLGVNRSTLWGALQLRCPILIDSKIRRFVASLEQRWGRGLRRYMAVHLRNVQDVPDLVQEVYLRILRIRDHEAIRNPEAYLFTVAGHVVRQHSLRQSTDWVVIDIFDAEEEALELQVPGGEDPARRAENAQRVERFQKEILPRLPPRVGAALVLHRIHGYTVQETANVMGISRETVKQYLADAVEYCRKSETRRPARRVSQDRG